MKPIQDLTGKNYGEWTVLARAEGNYRGHTRWLCVCSCGVQRVVLGPNLRSGKTSSCGHPARTAGGLYGQYTSEYDTWRQMTLRCEDPAHAGYPSYGARGIKVCTRWKIFSNFIDDMGPRPFQGAQLDRIDNDGDYEPANCRWVTAMENSHNSTSVRLLAFGGLNLPVAEWERRLGFKKGLVASRLHNGWTVERALTQVPRRSPQKPLCR